MVDTLTTSNVLYFPHIEFPDSTWLKCALCVWESVYRIVPEGYVPNDTDEVRDAIHAGALNDIKLSSRDLQVARDAYRSFLDSVPFIPDAIERAPVGSHIHVHQGKLDERMIAELSDLIGAITRKGDWLELPRGLADGYLLFLADAVAKRRALPKLTDSDTLFVAMQYFSMGGNMDEFCSPFDHEEDTNAALLFRGVLPGGLDSAPMKGVLNFRRANVEGRHAFRSAFEEVAAELAKVEDSDYAQSIIQQFGRRLKEAETITAARIGEFFSAKDTVLLYLGMPLLAKAFDAVMRSSDSIATYGAIAIAGIAALADVAKSCRKNWVPPEATYYCRLHDTFDGDTPVPLRMKRLDRMMNEFLND
jgi:hypothetical protein